MREHPPSATPDSFWCVLLSAPVFRMLWLTWLMANTCMWMNDVAAAWLMTTLTTSPVLVALVQTASNLPVFLLGLPSGALADILTAYWNRSIPVEKVQRDIASALKSNLEGFEPSLEARTVGRVAEVGDGIAHVLGVRVGQLLQDTNELQVDEFKFRSPQRGLYQRKEPAGVLHVPRPDPLAQATPSHRRLCLT